MRLICSGCSKNNQVQTGNIISKKHRFVAECPTCKLVWDPYIHEKEDEFYKAHKKAGTVFSSLNG